MHSQHNWADRIALMQDIGIGVVVAAVILILTFLVKADAHVESRQAASVSQMKRAERLSGVRAFHLEWRPYDMTGSSAFEEAYRDSGEPHYDRLADSR